MKKVLIVILSFGLGCSQGSYEDEITEASEAPLTHEDSLRVKTDSIIRTSEYKLLMMQKKKQREQEIRDSLDYELYLLKQQNELLDRMLYQETLVRNVPIDNVEYISPTPIEIELDSLN